MLGNISDEEANELLAYFSKSMIGNIVLRDASLESKIFPVMHYINTACYILYDQSYQYKILKKVVDKITPEIIARRSKALCSPLNQLAFYSIAMLYLQGRAAVIHDNFYKKKSNPNLVIEPESKKKETKFVLDFWKRLSPNFRNDGALTVENKEITFVTEEYINNLKNQMIAVDNNRDLTNKLRQTIAHLTIFNFLFQGECRAGISEHGPYYLEGNPLIFKEFQFLYTGKEIFGIDFSDFIWQKITKPSPIPNVIFGMTLKNMNKIEFNDWGTLFADPAEWHSNITSIGIWTKELMHPKELRYPDNMGKLIPLSLNILDELSEFAKSSTKELYVDYTKWDYTKKLMLGTSNYANNCMALCAGYAGIENDFNWTWADDYATGKPFKTDLLDKEKITSYIEHLKRWNGGHPFMQRVMRGRKIQKTDPFYYFLQD